MWNPFKKQKSFLPKRYSVYPSALNIQFGNLTIKTGIGTGPRTGVGTRVYIDGREIENILQLTLNIAVDELITATITVAPDFGESNVTEVTNPK